LGDAGSLRVHEVLGHGGHEAPHQRAPRLRHGAEEQELIVTTKMTPLQALRAARELVADETRWCRSAPARTLRRASRTRPAEWVRCAALDGAAMRWCAAGALAQVSGIESDPPGLRVLGRAALTRFGVGLGRANDDPSISHAAILGAFDEAIAALQRTEEG
jgi:hypothetical protein